ncbi:hypothetical protein ACIBG6_22100 [Streptomyces sp. NPDC050842]|uniref:hypothetical protein n=1 Tax=Streptomyces sp. NPDC050842 TaxID=3365636 RepID=UPI0037ADC5BD
MENNDDITLLRDAMDRTADGLPPLPDLAPLAVREGRRRRARARFAVGAAAFGVLTVGALGLTLLPSPGTDVAGVAKHIDAEAERERATEHQRKTAALLDELLPAKVTDIRPVEGQVAEYRITVDDRPFIMTVSVRPMPASLLQDCPDCEKDTRLKTVQIVDWADFKAAQYWYGKSRVTLSVFGWGTAVPLTARDLSAVTGDSRFLELVKAGNAHPLEPEEPLGGGLTRPRTKL